MRFFLRGLIINCLFVSMLQAENKQIKIENEGIKRNEVYNPLLLFSYAKDEQVKNYLFSIHDLPEVFCAKKEVKEMIDFPKIDHYNLSLLYYKTKPVKIKLDDNVINNINESLNPLTLKCIKTDEQSPDGVLTVRFIKNGDELMCHYMD